MKTQVLPNVLYKSFSCLRDAENFCTGNIRFKPISAYRKSDLARRDITEGIGSINHWGEIYEVDVKDQLLKAKPGFEHVHSEVLIPEENFICSFSIAQSDRVENLSLKFGKYVTSQ